MTNDPNPAVTFHRTNEGHLAARLDGHSMIAFPARDGRLSIWSAFSIKRPPEPASPTKTNSGLMPLSMRSISPSANHSRASAFGPATALHGGIADGSRRYGDGVVFHSTPSHGGFELSAEANAKVHPAWRNADRFYEEDIDCAKVAHASPDLFTAYERKQADRTLRNWEPDAYEEVHGLVLKPGQSRSKDEKRFQVEHANDWAVISTMTLLETPCMLECLASLGGKRHATWYKRFLVPSDEYRPGPFGFVIDESRHAVSDRTDRLRPEG